MEKTRAGYGINAVEFRQASEDIGLYAGSLSLALLGASPDTLQASPRIESANVYKTELQETIPTLLQLEEASRQKALRRLSRMSLHGSAEAFTAQDMS